MSLIRFPRPSATPSREDGPEIYHPALVLALRVALLKDGGSRLETRGTGNIHQGGAQGGSCQLRRRGRVPAQKFSGGREPRG